jgi:hypothetical protein
MIVRVIIKRIEQVSFSRTQIGLDIAFRSKLNLLRIRGGRPSLANQVSTGKRFRHAETDSLNSRLPLSEFVNLNRRLAAANL